MRRFLIAALALSLAAPVAAQAQSPTPSVSGPLAAPATRAAPVSVIDLVPWRTRWAVEAKVGGQPRKLMFDTGGGLTHLSPTVAEAAGCKLFSRITGYNMMGNKGQGPRCENLSLEMAGRRYTPAAVGTIDLGKMNPNDAALEGLLALDAFEGQAITLDLKAGHIVVESEASLAERTATMTPLRLRLARELGGLALAPYVAVPTKAGTLWFEFDSGNGGTLLVSKPNAKLFGLDPAKEGAQSAAFELAPGVPVKSDHTYTPDMIIDGNLGMPFLRDWIVTLDLKTSRAWIGRPAA